MKSLRQMLTLVGAALGLCLTVGACSAQDRVASPATMAASDSGAAAQTNVDESYRLGTSDHVRVNVFNEPTLSGEFTVSDRGYLSLPLVGDVQASGRTSSELAQDIQTKLKDGYLRDPRVNIDVLTFRPFYILGEVEKPGEYPYSNNLTAMNAVARAEGYTYRANKKRIFIKRAGEAEEKSYALTPDLKIYPGDTIRIGERYF